MPFGHEKVKRDRLYGADIWSRRVLLAAMCKCPVLYRVIQTAVFTVNLIVRAGWAFLNFMYNYMYTHLMELSMFDPHICYFGMQVVSVGAGGTQLTLTANQKTVVAAWEDTRQGQSRRINAEGLGLQRVLMLESRQMAMNANNHVSFNAEAHLQRALCIEHPALARFCYLVVRLVLQYPTTNADQYLLQHMNTGTAGEMQLEIEAGFYFSC